VINQQSGVARVDHLQLSMGLSAGVLVLVIIFTAVGVILRRWHQRSRMEQLQPLNEGYSFILLVSLNMPYTYSELMGHGKQEILFLYLEPH